MYLRFMLKGALRSCGEETFFRRETSLSMNFFLPNQINSAASWINWKDKLPTQFIMFNSHLSSFRLCSQVFVVTTCLSQMIAFFTAWTNPKTHQTSLHLPKNCICFCLEFPPLSGAIDKESAFCLITPIYFVSHSKTIYPCIRWILVN